MQPATLRSFLCNNNIFVDPAIGSQTRTRSSIVQWTSCGNSSEEARNNGCILDFISRAWLPRECYDAEPSEEFLHLKPWRWFADEVNLHELTQEVVERGDGPDPIFVSMDYHYHHCVYMWKKLHRAILLRRPIDNYLGGYKHTKHCADVLIAQEPAIVHFYLVFPSCPSDQTQ